MRHKCDLNKNGLVIDLTEDGKAFLDPIDASYIEINCCPFCGQDLVYSYRCIEDFESFKHKFIKDKLYKAVDQDEYYVYFEDQDGWVHSVQYCNMKFFEEVK